MSSNRNTIYVDRTIPYKHLSFFQTIMASPASIEVLVDSDGAYCAVYWNSPTEKEQVISRKEVSTKLVRSWPIVMYGKTIVHENPLRFVNSYLRGVQF